MIPMDCSDNYELLPSSPNSKHSQRRSWKQGSWSTYAAVAVVVICTILNVALEFQAGTFKTVNRTIWQYTKKDLASLRRPSQYIGFERISRPSPPVPRQFTNLPILLTQIDSEQPKKVFGQYLKKHAAKVGTVYPEIKRLQITNSISTVAQFRAADYGMEICELHINLPPSSSSISLFRLDESQSALDALDLSFQSRPSQTVLLSEITANPEQDTVWRRNFTCSLEQLLTFELACSETSSSSCSIDGWQSGDYGVNDPSIFLIQHATV